MSLGDCPNVVAGEMAWLREIRQTADRLDAEAGIEPSVGSIGDCYDNALAETINGLYKAEIIHRRGPWRSFEASSSPRWNGSTGSTTDGCSSPLEISHPPKPRPPTMPH